MPRQASMLRVAREVREDLLIPERIAMRTLRERSEAATPEVLAYMLASPARERADEGSSSA